MAVIQFPLKVNEEDFLKRELPEALSALRMSLNASALDERAIKTLEAVKNIIINGKMHAHWWSMENEWLEFLKLLNPLIQILRACESADSMMMREYLRGKIEQFDQEVKLLRGRYYGTENPYAHTA